MSVKKTRSTRKVGRDVSLNTAIDRLLKFPRTRVGVMKDMIYKNYNISTKGYNDYYDNLDKGTTKAEELHKILNKIYVPGATPFHKYSSEFNKWNNKYKAGMHPHHKEYSNISSQLRLLYEGLLDIQEDPALEFGQKDGKNALVYEFGTGDSAIYKPAKKENRTTQKGTVNREALADLKGKLSSLLPTVIEDFRKMYIIALALSRKTDIDADVDTINSITQDFVDKLDQAQYDIIKKNHVNVMSGKGKMEIEITSAEINQLLGEKEGDLGRWSQELLKAGSITDSDFSKATKGIDFGKIKGSKPIKDEITRQVAEIITKGTTSPSKSTTRRKKAVNKKKARKAPRINKLNSRAMTKARGAATAAVEKGNRENVMSLKALQGAINRRLPAEVRRNMGGEGLINRSGTFSNSPQLLTIRQAPTGLTGDYTYMKTGGGTPPRSGQRGVYGTFENHGRWGGDRYDPRELIKTSIRNLAMEIAQEKFVQLRRQ